MMHNLLFPRVSRVLLSLTLGAAPLAAVSAYAGDAPPTADDGKKLFLDKKNKCATCHGEDGKGQTKMGKKEHVSDMTSPEWQKKVTDQAIKDAIMKGLERDEGGKKVKMKPLEGATERDAEALLKFVRAFGSAASPPPKVEEKPAPPPPPAK